MADSEIGRVSVKRWPSKLQKPLYASNMIKSHSYFIDFLKRQAYFQQSFKVEEKSFAITVNSVHDYVMIFPSSSQERSRAERRCELIDVG